jgi:hypothetical protein
LYQSHARARTKARIRAWLRLQVLPDLRQHDLRDLGDAFFRHAELGPCGVPKLASYLQIPDFSGCAPNFGTPQVETLAEPATSIRDSRPAAASRSRDEALFDMRLSRDSRSA